ncbi:hypothetical protein HX071_17320 [Myroides marinus]|uniref:Cap15 family cyclic dinucleotide receptor domain-containing protein n=1 Tax=Myroides marinus TaxID=703342 RepID=UPI002575D41E|nr:hypothetical protein [Myroides marinus]MDM1503941.1 hypothetical protein [Myroides marinus]
MKKEELSKFVYISITISACLTLLYIFFTKSNNLNTFFRGTSLSITCVTLFWTFYFTLGWKIKGLKNIFYKPDLNGTWKGTLISDWKDENGNGVKPKEIFIIIRQNFLRIHFTTLTDTFVGYSYSETFNIKKDTGLKNVVYLYRKDTSQNNDEDLREGATELRLIISASQKHLSGKYWTNTKTQGRIEVSHISDKHVDSFNIAKSL